MKAKTVWISATQLPSEQYNRIHSWISGVAGEGDVVTPEDLGLTKRAFMYDTLYRIDHDLAQERHYDIVYSLSGEGDVCFELFSQYHK